jgi:hypothetical protein
MALDRNEMARLHEEFLARLNGGRKSKASGSTWKDQGDGRNNELTDDFAFAWDGKATRGQSITIDRAMIAKIREQAAGERPQIGLRWYGSDDLRQVDEDLIVITAADYAELLAAARSAVHFAQTSGLPVITVPTASQEQDLTGPGGWLPDPEWIREREGKWTSPPPALHGIYPADLPPPPQEMWPCLIVDSRHAPGDATGAMQSHGYQVDADGRVTEHGIHSVRSDMGLGWVALYVNDTIVRSGMLYVDGALRVQIVPKRTQLS